MCSNNYYDCVYCKKIKVKATGEIIDVCKKKKDIITQRKEEMQRKNQEIKALSTYNNRKKG